MSCAKNSLGRRSIVMAMLAAATMPVFGAGRSARIEEPSWLKLRISRIEAGVLMEGDYDTSSYDGGDAITYSRFFLGPELGLDMLGSVYHPQFCWISLTSQGAFGQTTEWIAGTRQESYGYLGRYRFNANLLNNKPLRVSLSVDQDHSYRDYDFFNRVIVDHFGYGARLSYDDTGPWAFNAVYDYMQEDINSYEIPYGNIRNTLGTTATHSRSGGATTLSYNFADYDYSGAGVADSSTESHAISIADAETFGSRKQFDLNTHANYSQYASTAQFDSTMLGGGVDLSATHSRRLKSNYAFMAADYESGALTTVTYSGTAGVQHELYESLTSSLQAFGSSSDYEDSAAEGYSRAYGVGWGEQYRKHIGTRHALQINNSLSVQQVQSKGISTIEREPHRFTSDVTNPTPDGFFLNQPNVIASTIVVRNATTFQIYLDYRTIVNGSLTLIERISGGDIPDGTSVLVDYQCEPAPEAEYQTVSETFRVRFDLWKNLLGVYAGVSLSRSDTPDTIRSVDFTRFTLGSDLRLRWFTAGGEFEQYYSDESDYRSLGFYQAASLSLGGGSSLSATLSERWIDYTTAGFQEEYYRFTTQYREQLTTRLLVHAAAGVSYRTGRWDDQIQAVFRPGLNYRIGRTTIQADYSLEYSLAGNSETRLENSIRLSLRRKF